MGEVRTWEAQLSKKREVTYDDMDYHLIIASRHCVDEITGIEVVCRSATYLIVFIQDERRSKSHSPRYIQSKSIWS